MKQILVKTSSKTAMTSGLAFIRDTGSQKLLGKVGRRRPPEQLNPLRYQRVAVERGGVRLGDVWPAHRPVPASMRYRT